MFQLCQKLSKVSQTIFLFAVYKNLKKNKTKENKERGLKDLSNNQYIFEPL